MSRFPGVAQNYATPKLEIIKNDHYIMLFIPFHVITIETLIFYINTHHLELWFFYIL